MNPRTGHAPTVIGHVTADDREVLIYHRDVDPYDTVRLTPADEAGAELGIIADLGQARPTLTTTAAAWTPQQSAHTLGAVRSQWRAFELEVLA